MTILFHRPAKQNTYTWHTALWGLEKEGIQVLQNWRYKGCSWVRGLQDWQEHGEFKFLISVEATNGSWKKKRINHDKTPFSVEKRGTLNQEKRNIPGRKRESVCVLISWKPTEKIGLKWFKELMVVYGMYSLYVRQNLNNWATQNRIISKDWKKLMITGTQNTLVTNCLSTLSVKGPPVQSVRRDQSRASGETRAGCQERPEQSVSDWIPKREGGVSLIQHDLAQPAQNSEFSCCFLHLSLNASLSPSECD